MAGNIVGQGIIVIGADASGVPDDLEKGLHKSTSKQVAIGSAVGTIIGNAVTRAATGIFDTVGLGFRTAMDNEVAQMKFTQLFKGQTDKAAGFVKDLQEFAKRTPFEFPGLQDAASRFLAVGVAADKVIPIMTNIGNVTSVMGSGAEGVDRVTLALQQMALKGKVSSEELMQMSEAGVPALKILADSMGVPTGQLQDMITKGLVPADEMFKAFGNTSGEELAKFAGGMDKMSQTTEGKLSTLRDGFSQLAGKIVSGVLPAFSGLVSFASDTAIPAIEGFGQTIGNVKQWFDEGSAAAKAAEVVLGGVLALLTASFVKMGIEATIAGVKAVAAWIAMAVAGNTAGMGLIGTLIAQAIHWAAMGAAAVVNAATVVGAWALMGAQALIHAAKVAAAWLIALGPIGLIIAAVVALVVIVVTNLDTIKEWISKAWDWITSTTYNVWQSIYSFFENIWNNITSWISNALDNIKGWINTAWEWIKSATAAAWDVIKWFIFGPIGAVVLFVTQNLDTIKATISGAWENIKSWTSNAWNTVVDFIRNAWQNIVNAVSEKVNAVITFARELPGRVVSAVGDLARTLWDKGTSIIQGLLDGAMEKIRSLGSWASEIKDKIINAIKAVFGIHSPSTVFADLGVNMMKGLLQGLLQGPEILKSAIKSIGGTLMDWLGGLGSRVGEFFSGLFGGGGGAAGGAARWAGVAQQAMAMAGLPASFLPLLLQRMNVESGGNPNAINLWDSNAKRGTPSIGLMQTIGPTFDAYAGPLRGLGITNPLANIYAAIKYSLARYGIGGIPRAWGGRGGYALGTPSAMPGWALVGERGPEWMRFRGGETVLPNGRSPGTTITVNMTISVDDLDKMSKIGDFIDMLDRARLDNRRTARSGMVAA